MKLLKKYLLHTYSHTFFPIFFTLYIITSIVYLVKIATLTSIIQIDFLELIKLYSFSIPTILFYTLPISIFISLSFAFSKLSSEYELIVITSFGLNPLKIIKLILPNLLLATIFMSINNLILLPKADYMSTMFIYEKKVAAIFNIKASEYGQQFGNWLMYVEKKDKNIYKDIVLLNLAEDNEKIIVAKNAVISNNISVLSLKLTDGRLIDMKDSFQQIDFQHMVINNKIDSVKYINSFDDIIFYWKDIRTDNKKMNKFVFSVLLSIFPLISIFFIISLGYYNPRYDKNNTSYYALTLTIFYIILTKKLAAEYLILALYFTPLIWVLFGCIYYTKKTKKLY